MFNNPEINVASVFIVYHTFLIALIRPFSVTFSKDLLNKLYDISYNSGFNKGAGDSLTTEIMKAYRKIENYRYWEGAPIYFSSNFWLIAILTGFVYLFSELNIIKCFDQWLFVLLLIYLILTFFVIIKLQWSYISRNNTFLIFILFFYYVLPSSLYFVKRIFSEDIGILLLITFLSSVYFIMWNITMAKYGPIAELQSLIIKVNKKWIFPDNDT